ncbi:hypothetical protein Dsin_012045 [Dipteronia sinensis]|uniref:F-box domain-containing protein n=1 Tax=Dipteronia sinensis TaxID=43782 RepID=A0AAE0AHY3_9ROSI|nr:hypothetical protein Dsin_012045 [Dipteronia sinensis]
MSSIHLPIEVLYNILGRLPVRDLIRFTCVCKPWRDFITNPDFISTHLNLHRNIDGYVLHHKMASTGAGLNCFSCLHDKTYVEHSRFDIPFSCESFYFHLAGSLNGLLCLSDSYQYFGRTIYLWNPSIWKLKILRRTCFTHSYSDFTNFFAIGFGFDHHTNDYKIVRIMYFGDFYRHYVEKQQPKAEVYSLARNSWRRIGTNAGSYAIDKISTAFVNGAVHWFASKPREACGNFILTFDFGSEEFGEITLPRYQSDGIRPQVSVTVLRESLALIVSCFNNRELSERCNIWVMSEYGMAESWTKRYSIVLEERFFRCLGIINNNELVLDKSTREELVSYDLENMQFKHLAISKYTKDVVNFSVSLVLYNEGFRLTPRKYLFVEGGISLGKRKRSVFMHLQRKWL